MSKVVSVKNKLPAIVKDLDTRGAELVERTAHLIAGKTKENLVAQGAVRTGNLLNSYQVEMEGRFAAIVGTAVAYAPHVEYGTAKMAARPHLTPAGNDPQVRKNFLKTLLVISKPKP